MYFQDFEGDRVIKFLADLLSKLSSHVLAASACAIKVVFKVYKWKRNVDTKARKHLRHGSCTDLTRTAKLVNTLPPLCLHALRTTSMQLCADLRILHSLCSGEIYWTVLKNVSSLFAGSGDGGMS